MNSKRTIKPVGTPAILLILDGWGIGPSDFSNAIHAADTPNFDSYCKRYAHARLEASSVSVGLPKGQDGNSEAGHMNIGAGRIVEQDSVAISRAISDGTFFKNPAFLQAVKHAHKRKSNVHIMGLLSNGQSAHSHPDHILALITFFHYQNVPNCYLHLFTDGRDSNRYSALPLLRKHHSTINSYATVASITGRVYAMDRKKDWRHTKLAYEAMVDGHAPFSAPSAQSAVKNAYDRGETDEFIQPTVIERNGQPVATIRDGDVVVFVNLRSDRARQLAKPFCQASFETANVGSFKRKTVLKDLFFVAMTDFGPDLGNILTAFPSRDIPYALPVALVRLRQLYIAEGEKYAHITYFFNGGFDQPIAGEDRRLVPSPDALSYINHPEMSLGPMTTMVVAALKKKQYDFIGMNVSNADMIAHTGSLEATKKAVEYIDQCLKRIVDAALSVHGTVFITADHGNAEELVDRESGEINTEHSKSLVPFIMIREGKKAKFRTKGVLADVAPTILEALHMPVPKVMTGKSLIL